MITELLRILNYFKVNMSLITGQLELISQLKKREKDKIVKFKKLHIFIGAVLIYLLFCSINSSAESGALNIIYQVPKKINARIIFPSIKVYKPKIIYERGVIKPIIKIRPNNTIVQKREVNKLIIFFSSFLSSFFNQILYLIYSIFTFKSQIILLGDDVQF